LLANTPVAAALGSSVQSSLQIRLLGSPEVTWLGQPVALARRQSRALLYRLAAASRPVPRDELCFLFWPDTADTVARRNLTVLLNHLRRELPQADLITSTGDTLALARPAVWTDLLAFATEGNDKVQHLVALYRGPFLHGFTLPASPEFAAWAAQEGLVWERRYLDLLTTLVEQQINQGEYAAAIVSAQHYLAVDELAEEMHRRLIWLFAANGDRAAALRQFDRCAALLEQELDVTPLPATWALYESVRDGTLQLEPVQARQERHAPSAGISSPCESLLPLPQSPLLGREAELATAQARLQEAHVRLLTLVGPGGSGKTRLALALANELQPHFAQGVRFVSLAALHDPALVIEAIARACGLHATERLNGAPSLTSAPGPSLTSQLRDHLRDKQLLLVLDNFEHLLPAGARVAELLTFAPQVRLLITSRAPLHLSGEHLLPVSPLPLPDLADLPALDQLAQQPAVALLVARAQALLPAFQLTSANAPAVAAICVRLDGLPLAIELAAARLRLLSPQALLHRLDHQLTLLTSGPTDLPARQQTLWATIDWSYGLLAPHEQRIFQRLALFAGGWTLEAAEAIVTDDAPFAEDAITLQRVLDGLTSLVDQSLIRQEPGDGEPRFSLLATIRDYALHQLVESGEAAHMHHCHARYYLEMAEAADLHGRHTEQAAWLTRLEREHDNLRAALAWSLAGTTPAEQSQLAMGVRLAAALGPFWYLHGHLGEGRAWLAQALAVSDHTGIAPSIRVRALSGAARLAWAQGDYTAARTLAQAGLTLAQAQDDALGCVEPLHILGDIAQTQGDYTQAQASYQQSLTISRSQHDQPGIALALRNLGSLALVGGRLDEAQTLFEASQTRFYALGDRWGIAQAFYSLGEIAHHRGDYHVAAQRYAQSVDLYRNLGNHWSTAWLLNKLGEVAHYRGENERAIELYHESLALFRKLDHREGIALALHNLSYEYLLQGEYAQAQTFHEESRQLFQQSGVKWGIGITLSLLGVLRLAQGDVDQARRLQEQSLAIWQALGTKRGMVLALTRLGIVAHAQHDYAQAITWHRQCFTLAWEAQDRLGMALGLEGLAAALVAQRRFDRAARLLGAAVALRTRMGAPRRQLESTPVEQTLTAVYTRLDNATLKAAWDQGRTAPLEQLVAELAWLAHPPVVTTSARLHAVRPFSLVATDSRTGGPEPVWPVGAGKALEQRHLPNLEGLLSPTAN
jgi:predicted ATPase/DNA-binding SARP family transcriptional activator